MKWTLTGLIQAHDVISQVGAPSGGHDFDSSQVFTDLDADLAHLQRQLTGGHHDNGWEITMYRRNYSSVEDLTVVIVTTKANRRRR